MTFDFRTALDDDSATYTVDLAPMIREQTRRVNAAMDTAARHDVIAWLRANGYAVYEPADMHDARSIAEAVVERWEGIVGTHYDGCWQTHAACLAHLILDTLDLAPTDDTSKG